MGTFVEYYDYALYGFSAALIADAFFPTADPAVGLIKSFGVFAIGFAAKPLGSAVFGKISDTLGRRFTLKYSIMGVAIPTTLIGFLPNYTDWGIAATMILIVCRFCQGLFVSAEYDAAAIYLIENVNKERHCLAKSLIPMSATLGVLAASSVLALMKILPVPHWAWRIPFLIGGVLAVMTVLLRKNFEESFEFSQYKKDNQSDSHIPLKQVIQNNWRPMLAAMLVCGGVGGLFNFYIMFWNTYLNRALNLFSETESYIYTTITIASYVLLYPLSGVVADKYGREKTLFWGCIASTVLFAANMLVISQGAYSIPLQILTAGVIPFSRVTGYVIVTKMFPVEQRHRCLGLAHAMGSMIFSGTAPLVGMTLWKLTGIAQIPLAYCFVLIGMILVSIAYLVRQKTYNQFIDIRVPEESSKKAALGS